MAEETATGLLSGRVDAVREHIASVFAALPALPAELSRVLGEMAQEAAARGPGALLALIIGFVVLGLAVEAVFRRFVKEKPAPRLVALGLRLARELAALAAFALGSAVAFLAFDWPPQIRSAVLAFLAALLALRLTIVVSRALLSPRDAGLRAVPLENAAALFGHR